MPYLTYERYSDISFEPVEEEVFNKLLKPATVKLDVLSRYFYNRVDFEGDFEKRKNAWKTALTYQIDFFNAYGSTTSYEINNAQSVTIGRTSLTNGNSGNSSISTLQVPNEVLDILTYWGFISSIVGTSQC